MATSGTIVGAYAYNDYAPYIKWSVTQDVINNKSTMSVTFGMRKQAYNDSSYSGYGTDLSITVNGTTYTRSITFDFRSAGYPTDHDIVTISGISIPHNTDGTKTVSISASHITGISLGTGSLSGSAVLNQIPRASTLNVSNGTLGTNLSMTINRSSDSFRHTITYKCGTKSGTIGTNLTTSGTWTDPPKALAAEYPKASKVSVTLTLDTYNSGTKIGTSTRTIEMTVPSDVKPTITEITTSCPDGHLASTSFGTYVQNKSRVTVGLSISTGQGSAIRSYSIKIGSKLSYTSNNVTSDVIPESGTVTIKATVTDERGRTSAETTKTISVHQYSAPSISSFNVVRVDASENPDDTGDNVKITYDASVTSIKNGSTEKNAGVYKLYYKAVGSTTYSSETLSSSGALTLSADTGQAYEYYMTVNDQFNTPSRSVTVRVPSASVLIQTTANMDGLAIGRSDAVSGLLRLAWGLEVEGGLRNTSVTGSILDFALAAPLGLTPIYTGEATTALPTVGGSFTYSVGFVQRRVADPDPQVFVCLISYTTATIATNSYVGSRSPQWTGWAIADPCVSWGTSGIWTYRKWASGYAECWGVQTGLTANLTTQWGSSGLYYNSGDGKAPDFPFAFTAKPAVTVSVENGSGVSLIAMTNGSGGSTTKAPAVQLCRAGSASNVAYTLHWHAIGRWR